MDWNLVIVLLLSLGIGVSLGLLGGGGSIVTVPVLVYAAGVAPLEAVGMSLVVVGLTSLVGAVIKWRSGGIHFRASLVFGVTGIVGALIGAQGTPHVPSDVLLTLFALIMIGVAVRMLAGRDIKEIPAAAQCQLWRCVLSGFGVGGLTGFIGVGGGVLIVPALTYFGQVPIRKAVGTSLLIIALNASAGAVTHLIHGEIDWSLTVPVSLAALVGMAFGLIFSPRISQVKLTRAFAIFILGIALFIFFKIIVSQELSS